MQADADEWVEASGGQETWGYVEDRMEIDADWAQNWVTEVDAALMDFTQWTAAPPPVRSLVHALTE